MTLSHLNSRWLRPVAVLTLSLVFLQGCAVALVGAGAVGVKAATDRRTLGTQLDDQTIEYRAQRAISETERFDNARILAVAYNKRVLLIGQAPSEDIRRQAEQTVRDAVGAAQVHNEVRVRSRVGFTTKTEDSWITSKVKTALLSDERVDGSQIKVVTENGEVFLMGIVANEEAGIATDIARNTAGVVRVITAFIKP